jgi:hypothetical protein
VYLKGLRYWFVYPANLDCKRTDLDSHGALNRFIAANYHLVERVGPSMVLQRDAAMAGAPRPPDDRTSLDVPAAAVP